VIERLGTYFGEGRPWNVAAVLGTGQTVWGIHETEYAEDLDIAGRMNAFTCAEADLGAIAVGHTLTIDGVTHRVEVIEPDGTGVVRLRLEAQSP
jgi:hypothetical protein